MTSLLRQNDGITSKWCRFDVITTLLLHHVFSVLLPDDTKPLAGMRLRAISLELLNISIHNIENYFSKIITTFPRGHWFKIKFCICIDTKPLSATLWNIASIIVRKRWRAIACCKKSNLVSHPDNLRVGVLHWIQVIRIRCYLYRTFIVWECMPSGWQNEFAITHPDEI